MFKEMIGEAAPLVEKFAPTVFDTLSNAKHINIPFRVVSFALQLIYHFFVKGEKVEPSDIAKFIVTDPDVEALLRVIENKFIKYLQEHTAH